MWAKLVQNSAPEHVKPQANMQMKLLIYYKNRTAVNLFVQNNPHRQNPEQRSHVVCRYTCTADECHPSEKHIGQTTTPLKIRMTTNAQNGSIKNHNHDKHQRRLHASEILLDVDVLHLTHDHQEIVWAEALLIKSFDLHLTCKGRKKLGCYVYFNLQIS